QRDRADLTDIVRSAIENQRPLLDKRRHVLSVAMPEPAYAHVDATRISQIIGNLLHNAAKFTPSGGQIAIELAREGDHAVIRVSDSGEGIPHDQLERVFDMFARIESRASKSDQGLGIGLALGRRLAEMHGGTLVAHSAGLGKGTTFTLRLPATR